jgi:hypothetical protein
MATYPPEIIARIAQAQRIEDPEARAIALFRIEFDTNAAFRVAVLAHIASTMEPPRVKRPPLRNTAPIVRVTRLLDRRARREIKAGREPLWTLRIAYAYIYNAYRLGDESELLLYAGIPLMNWLSGNHRYMPLGIEGRLSFVHSSITRLRHYATQFSI